MKRLKFYIHPDKEKEKDLKIGEANNEEALRRVDRGGEEGRKGKEEEGR